MSTLRDVSVFAILVCWYNSASMAVILSEVDGAEKDSKYYFCRKMKQDQKTAQKYCRALNSQLVTINSRDEMEALSHYVEDHYKYGLVGKIHFWVNAAQTADGSRFKWLRTGSEIRTDDPMWCPNANWHDHGSRKCMHVVMLNYTGCLKSASCDDAFNGNYLFRCLCEVKTGDRRVPDIPGLARDRDDHDDRTNDQQNRWVHPFLLLGNAP